MEILPIWTFYCGIQREDLSWLRNTRCPAYCRRGTLVPYMCSGAISLFWCRTYYICSGAIPLFWCRTCVLVPYLCSGVALVLWCRTSVLSYYCCCVGAYFNVLMCSIATKNTKLQNGKGACAKFGNSFPPPLPIVAAALNWAFVEEGRTCVA